MEYFWITQDKRYLKTPFIENLRSVAIRSNFNILNASKIDDKNVVFANSEYPSDYIDILDTQLFLVTEKVKNVFSVYDNSITYKMFCILNNQYNSYQTYYAPIFYELDCISSFSETNLNKSYIKKLILQKNKISNFCIFKLKGVATDVVIIRIDVAESLMRRKPHGIIFSKVFFEE